MTTNFYHTSACRVQHCYSISICPVECWYYVTCRMLVLCQNCCTYPTFSPSDGHHSSF